jgi:hypothetical protein
MLSKLIRNKHKHRNDHIQMIIIEDLNSVGTTSPDSSEDSHPQYELVSNFPPFLQNCEGFSGIRPDLKSKSVQEKSPDSDQQQLLPNMEPVCCDECLAWIQRYYTDIPYLRMHLN